MTTEDAKAYLARRQIPQLFESLMTGLMYYRPEDHVHFLQDCLTKLGKDGVDAVKWNLFIDKGRKTPLPPITQGQNGRRVSGGHPVLSREGSQVVDEIVSRQSETNRSSPRPSSSLSLDGSLTRSSPLPPIGTRTDTNTDNRIQLPNCPIVLLMGGPGSGKATHCERLVNKYPGWVHLSVGGLLRRNILEKGSAEEKWSAVSALVKRGEMAPEEVTRDLLESAIHDHMDAAGLIIEGYPRTARQRQEFDQQIGRVDMVIMLDCEEYQLQQRLLKRGNDTGRLDDNINAVAARLSFFKENTLPTGYSFDKEGKLTVVDGDRGEEEIFLDLTKLFDNLLSAASDRAPPATDTAGPVPGAAIAPRPPSASKPTSRPGSRYRSRSTSGVRHSPVPAKLLQVEPPDTGRVDGLPPVPIVFVLGGPGSGRGVLSARLTDQFPGVVHISVGASLRSEAAARADTDSTWATVRDAVMSGQMAPLDVVSKLVHTAIQDYPDATAVLIDGFPRNKEQVESFNKMIGGANLVVMIDCSEAKLQVALSERGGADDTPDAIAARLALYRQNTLPVAGHYDELGRLLVVNGDRESEAVYTDLVTALEPILSGAAVSLAAEKLDVEVEDEGRKSGLATCPILSIMGGPGSNAEELGKRVADIYPNVLLLSKDDKTTMMEELSSKLTSPPENLNGVVLVGFPNTKSSLEQFNQSVGGMTRVILVDHSEAKLRELATDQTENLENFRKDTLPVLGHYDDKHTLTVVKGDREVDEIFDEIRDVLQLLLQPPPPHEDMSPEKERKPGMPQCHIVSVIGIKGAGTDEQCRRLVEKYPGTTHLTLSNDDDMESVSQKLETMTDSKLIVLEGFPASRLMVEDYNEHIGALNGVLLLDLKEDSIREKLTSPEDLKVLSDFKHRTLPVLHHYDVLHRLYPTDAERTPDEVFDDVTRFMDEILSVPADALVGVP